MVIKWNIPLQLERTGIVAESVMILLNCLCHFSGAILITLDSHYIVPPVVSPITCIISGYKSILICVHGWPYHYSFSSALAMLHARVCAERERRAEPTRT